MIDQMLLESNLKLIWSLYFLESDDELLETYKDGNQPTSRTPHNPPLRGGFVASLDRGPPQYLDCSLRLTLKRELSGRYNPSLYGDLKIVKYH